MKVKKLIARRDGMDTGAKSKVRLGKFHSGKNHFVTTTGDKAKGGK